MNEDFDLHSGAAQDIRDIWEFIAEDNPLAARRVREEILSAIRAFSVLPASRPSARGSHRAALTLSARARLLDCICTGQAALACSRRPAWPPRSACLGRDSEKP